MGIIKAAGGALGGALADQWLEYYYCEAMPEGVLALKGTRKVSEKSSNTRSDPDIISDGSCIAVNEGQCALVIETGKVIALFDKPGENVFRSKETASVFSGGKIGDIIEQSINRFGFGGDVGFHQFVIYLDLREHTGNEFSVSCPVRIRRESVGMDIDFTVNMSGMFSYRITDPLVFYKRICRNAAGTVYASSVLPQLTEEFRSAAIAALAGMCEKGVMPAQLPSMVPAICEAIKDAMTEEWVSLRGMSVVSAAISSIAVTGEDMNVIQTAEEASVYTDPSLAAGLMAASQAHAMEAAAQNPSGAASGFVGIAAANTVASSLAGIPRGDGKKNPAPEKNDEHKELWYCPCGTYNTGDRCKSCGKAKE